MSKNNAKLLSHHLCQTGRTTRMLTHLADTLLKDQTKTAMVVCPTQHYAPLYKMHIEQLPLFTPVQVEGILRRTLFQPAEVIAPSMRLSLLNPPANSNVLYYVDHSVIEMWYATALRELHRWDSFLRL